MLSWENCPEEEMSRGSGRMFGSEISRGLEDVRENVLRNCP